MTLYLIRKKENAPHVKWTPVSAPAYRLLESTYCSPKERMPKVKSGDTQKPTAAFEHVNQ